jgi:heme/copper-type cytochrome/quinol oxidase subunit 1
MRGAHRRAILGDMPLWLVTVLICSIVWVIGTIVVVVGATWLVRHEPH